MRFLSFALTSSLSLFYYGGQAIASPVAYSNHNGELIIDNRTSSTVLSDSESSRTGWVLPPTGGIVEPKGFTPSANLGFCPGVKDLQIISNTIIQRLKVYSKQYLSLENESNEENKRISEIDSKLSMLSSSDDLENKITRNDKAVLRLYSDMAEIKADPRKDKETIEREMKEKGDEILLIKKETSQLLDMLDEVHRLEKYKNSIEKNYDSLRKREDDLVDRMSKLRLTVDNLYKDRVKIEGGYVFVDYDLKWEENLRKLKQYNSHYDFKQIPTKNARIFANFIAPQEADIYFSTLPLLIDYSVAGMKYSSWGKREEGNLYSLPNIINGEFRLNLLGACPIYDKNFFKGSSDTEIVIGTNGYPVFGIHATYDYPIVYKFKVHAEYNLYRVYEEIRKKSQSNGFFSKKNYSELFQSKKESDSMKITIEDEGSALTDQERFKMLETIKADIISKVLGSMAEPVPGISPFKEKDLELPQGQSGAAYTGDAFHRSCGLYNFCWVSGWILKGLDSIWGSREAETHFKGEYNKTVVYDWTLTNPTYRSSSTGFERTKNI